MRKSLLLILPLIGLLTILLRAEKAPPIFNLSSADFLICVYGSADIPLPGAELRLSDPDTSFYADVDGCLRIDLPLEELEAEIRFPGFISQTLTLKPGEPARVVLERTDITTSSTTRYRTEDVEGMVDDDYALESVAVTATAPPDAAMPREHRMSISEDRLARRRDVSSITASTAGVASPAPVAERPALTREEAFSRGLSAGDYEPVDGDLPGGNLPEAGQLTAGEVNDFGKWDLWKDVSLEDLYVHRETWGIFPDHRYGVQLRYANGSPIIDAEVVLRTSAGRSLWRGRTDNQGRAELWRSIYDQQDIAAQERLEIVASIQDNEYILETAHAIQEGYNSLTIEEPCDKPSGVDVAFVIDATGSMGDELNYLASELLDVMGRATDSLSADDLRLGAVVYRDEGDEYVTRHSDLNDELDATVDFIKAQSAGGGGDTPEAVEEGLATALESLNWREAAAARLLFLVLDAPPHQAEENLARLRQMTAAAARRGIRIIPVVCSGMQPDGEYLLRSMALATNGTYTFLTDHSGIGGTHLEPSTDSYEVEKLNELLLRLIVQFGRTGECDPESSDPIADIELPAEEIEWTAYPNPTFGPVTLEFPTVTGRLIVLDELGKALRQYEVASDKLEISLGNLASGTYLLRFENEEGQVSTRRVMVQFAR